MLHLTTLGGCRADPQRFPRGGLPLLALVRVLIPSKPPQKDVLIRALWRDSSSSRLHHRLRQLLFLLRRAYPELELRIEGERVLTHRTAVCTDYVRSLELARTGDLMEALKYQRGEFLADTTFPAPEFAMWVDGVRASQARHIRGWVTELLLRDDSAIKYLEESLGALAAASPRDPTIDLLRARIFQWNGRISAARTTLEKCHRRLPANCRALAQRMKDELGRARRNRLTSVASNSPFVGRSNEMNQLQHAWRCACLGQLRCCEVLGEAGIGKTRLAYHFARWVALQGGKPVLIRGDNSIGVNLEQLLSELGFRPPSQSDGTAARYWANSVELVLNALNSTAAQQPIAITIDDYQLADESIRQLLHLITVRLLAKPILVVIITRSARDTPPMMCAWSVTLSRFSDQEARQLIATASQQSFEESVIQVILARSLRSPLALLAWVRLIAHEPNAERQRAILATTAPSTLLQDLIRRRSPAARIILQCLSLVESPYPIRALRRVAGIPRETLQRELDSLVAEGLVGWSSQGVQLAHALYRLDSAAALENESSTVKHRLLALSLIGCGPRAYKEIARLFERAGDHREAVRYYLRAVRVGVRAASRADADECVVSALRLCNEHGVPDNYVQLAQAHIHYEWEEYGAAADKFRIALQSNVSLRKWQALEVRIKYVRSATLSGTLKPSSESLRTLLNSARTSGKTALELAVAYTMLQTLPYGRRRRRFRQLAEDFRNLAVRFADEALATRALSQASILYLAGELPRLAMRLGQESLDRALAFADHHSIVEASAVLGAIQLSRGAVPLAAETFAVGQAALQHLGYTPRRQLWFTNYGVYLLECGRWEQAESVFHQGLEENLQAGTGATLNAHVKLNFAILYYESGQRRRAATYARELAASDLNASVELTAGVAIQGLIALEDGDLGNAKAVAERLSSSKDFFGDESYHCVLLARVYAADGQAGRAIQLLQTAYPRLRRTYYPAAARVQLELLRLTEPRRSGRLLEFAADCERRGLTPLAERARN